MTIETAPDTGHAPAPAEVATRIDPDAPELAQACSVRSSTRTRPAPRRSRRTCRSRSARLPGLGGKKRSTDEMARELAPRACPASRRASPATGAGAARPLTAQELCEVVRIAYDPGALRLIDQANAAGEPPELSWPEVGPSAAEARWDTYRHDSGLSSHVDDEQRASRQRAVEHPDSLCSPRTATSRASASRCCTGRSTRAGRGIVEADVRAASFNLSSSDKPTARTLVETRAAFATANEEASGAGLVNFGMLVTATVTDAAADGRARGGDRQLSRRPPASGCGRCTARRTPRSRPRCRSASSAEASAVPTEVKEQL